jgi:hypothetical protein
LRVLVGSPRGATEEGDHLVLLLCIWGELIGQLGWGELIGQLGWPKGCVRVRCLLRVLTRDEVFPW